LSVQVKLFLTCIVSYCVINAACRTVSDVTLQELQGEYERPWQSEVPPLEQSVEVVEKYPSDEEENGMVVVGWRGPLSKVITVTRMKVLSVEMQVYVETFELDDL